MAEFSTAFGPSFDAVPSGCYVRDWDFTDIPVANQVFWYTPDDETKVTLNTSDDRRIDTLIDNFGNFDATAENGNWPFWSETAGVAGINGKRSIYTTAVARWFNLPSGVYSGAEERGFWGIVEDTRDSTVYATFGADAGDGARWTVRRTPSAKTLRVETEGAGYDYSTVPDTACMVGTVLRAGGTLANNIGIIDGSRASAVGTSVIDTATSTNHLFARDPSGVFAPVRMGEMIATRGNIGLATEQLIEGRLAWENGTNGSLPTEHPYYTGRPVWLDDGRIVPADQAPSCSSDLDQYDEARTIPTWCLPMTERQTGKVIFPPESCGE